MRRKYYKFRNFHEIGSHFLFLHLKKRILCNNNKQFNITIQKDNGMKGIL